ncbi:hypothetical protein AB0B51_33160 [Streptomyces griseus]|uniref:hypothetical protein n=1 Tax=Streptomyces griseus TaxID=1911 RepID=UPI0004C50BEF|nr:hypothetical protein [Streptomyces griseus]
MIASLTWQPDDTDQPETVTIDMPAHLVADLQHLIDARHDFGDAVAWIPTRDDAGAYIPRLFRLARITATEGAR